MWAVRSAPEISYFIVSRNLLESIISMVKVSKAPSVAVQERLKLSRVMSETFKFPISGSPAEKKGGWVGEKKQINLSESFGCALKLRLLIEPQLGRKI